MTEATTTSAGTKTLTNHYDDASDETAWTSTLKADGTTVIKRYVDGIDGNLAATVADDGTVKLDLTNLHGDTVATVDPDATSIGSYHETTEYGLPRDAASAADDYAWLGGTRDRLRAGKEEEEKRNDNLVRKKLLRSVRASVSGLLPWCLPCWQQVAFRARAIPY